MRTTSDKENWRLAKKLDPKMRIFVPVIVRGEEAEGVKLYKYIPNITVYEQPTKIEFCGKSILMLTWQSNIYCR